jgi:hypothetical protein
MTDITPVDLEKMERAGLKAISAGLLARMPTQAPVCAHS